MSNTETIHGQAHFFYLSMRLGWSQMLQPHSRLCIPLGTFFQMSIHSGPFQMQATDFSLFSDARAHSREWLGE